jgi:hypothetical protein
LKKSFTRWGAIGIASAILFLGSWALSSPIGSSPDDNFHNASIWCGQGYRDGLCQESNVPGNVDVAQTLITNDLCFSRDATKSGACPESLMMVPTAHVNLVMNLYPDFYYWTMSWLASENLTTSILLMRFANLIIIVFVLSILVIFLPTHLKAMPLLGVLASSIPLGVFLITSVNPSGWAYVSVIFFFSAFVGFLSSQNLRSQFILGGASVLSFILGAGSRTDAALFLILAMALAWLITFSKVVLKPSSVLLSVALILPVVGTYFSTSQARGTLAGGAVWVNDGVTPMEFQSNLLRLPELWMGVFGTWGLGWLDTPMPTMVWFLTLSIFTAVVFSTFRGFTLLQGLAVSLSFLALIVVPMVVLTQNGQPVGGLVQPRYLLPLIGLLVTVSLWRKTASGSIFSSPQLIFLSVGLVVANMLALHTNLRRYLTGIDYWGLSLTKQVEWWWVDFALSPNHIWFIGTFSFALLLFSIWKLREYLGLGNKQKNSPIP